MSCRGTSPAVKAAPWQRGSFGLAVGAASFLIPNTDRIDRWAGRVERIAENRRGIPRKGSDGVAKVPLEDIQKARRSAAHQYAWRMGEGAFREKVGRAWQGLILGFYGEGGPVPIDALDRALLVGLSEEAPHTTADPLIAAATCGLLWPADPAAAAGAAWARLKDLEAESLYAVMFVAATYSVSFVADDLLEALYVGMSEVPDTSRLYRCVKALVRGEREEADMDSPIGRDALDAVAALLDGEGDFERIQSRLASPSARAIASGLLGVFDEDKSFGSDHRPSLDKVEQIVAAARLPRA